jgi:hypothetical protein
MVKEFILVVFLILFHFVDWCFGPGQLVREIFVTTICFQNMKNFVDLLCGE